MISQRKFRLLILFYLILHLLNIALLYDGGFQIDISDAIPLQEYLTFSEENFVYVFFLYLGQFVALIYMIVFLFRVMSIMALSWFWKRGPFLFAVSFILFDILSPCFVWWYGSVLNECEFMCEGTTIAEVIFSQPVCSLISVITGVVLVIIYSNMGRHLFSRNDNPGAE